MNQQPRSFAFQLHGVAMDCLAMGVLTIFFSIAGPIHAAPVPFDLARNGAFNGGPGIVELYDWDGDGDLEIFMRQGSLAHQDGGRLWQYESSFSGSVPGELTWSSASMLNLTISDFLMGHAVADFNSDGSLDLIYSRTTGELVFRWFDHGTSLGDLSDADPSSTLDAGPLLNGFAGPRLHSGDVDGDGAPELLGFVDEAGFSGLVWWQPEQTQNWSRTAVAARPVATDSPITLEVGDIDGDSDQDIVVIWSTPSIYWYENTSGDGSTWTAHVLDDSYSLISGIPKYNSLSLVDFDEDGDLDTLSLSQNIGSNNLTLWTNPRPISAASSTPWSLQIVADTAPCSGLCGPPSVDRFTVADFDDDGDDDILSSRSPVELTVNSLSYWDNEFVDQGGFLVNDLPDIQDTPLLYLDAGDIDQDGDLDFVYPQWHPGVDEVQWSENQLVPRSTLFPLSTNLETGAVGDRLVTFDRNDDGHDEIAWSSPLNAVIGIFERDPSSGTWSAEEVSSSTSAADIAMADINLDGHPDLVSVLPDDDKVLWRDGTPGGGWPPKVIYALAGSDPQRLVVSDFNHDGWPDVAFSSSGDQKLTVLLLDASNPPTIVTVDSAFANAIDAADVDGDGDQDLVAANSAEGIVVWYDNSGTGASWTKRTIGSLASACGVRVRKDQVTERRASIVATNGSTVVDFWSNSSSAMVWLQRNITKTALGCELQVFDLDRDGDRDVLTGVPAGGAQWFASGQFPGASNFYWAAREVIRPGDESQSLGIGDFDRDGHPDVALSSVYGNQELIALLNQTGQFRLTGSNTAQQFIAPGDFEDLLRVRFEKVYTDHNYDADAGIAVEALEVQFLDEFDQSLSAVAIDKLIAEHRLYWDQNRNGVFEDGDPERGVTTSYLGNGRVRLDGSITTINNVSIPYDYFYVVELQPDADQQAITRFKVKLLQSETPIAQHNHAATAYSTPLQLERAGQEPSTGLISPELDSTSCKAPLDLYLAGVIVSTEVVCEAGESLTTNDLSVLAPNGNLTLRAGSSIALGTNTTIATGSQLTIEID